jgi:alpha-tubulin suppressor-like RCC1 family protein
MFVGRSSARRLGWAVLLGALPIGLGACGLLIGLDDHQAFPGGDAGEDAKDPADASADGLADVVEDALPDVLIDGCAGTICNDTCVDLASSSANCGACDALCPGDYDCVAGVCGNRIDQISAGANHGCALLHDGSIWCWGSDGSGQLGIPPGKDTKCNGVTACQPTPTRVEGLPSKMIQVSAGADFTCGIQEGGVVWCWGLNSILQLGRATTMGTPDPTFDRLPAPVPGLPPIAQVATGYEFACARAADGSKVYCWGSNLAGALGNGQKENTAGGVPPGDVVAVPSGVIDISTGLGGHACALTATHEAWCWGANSYGQLGHSSAIDVAICPTTKCTSTPAKVAGLIVAGDRITATVLSTCAESSAGFVCWGSNIYGQLGTTPDMMEHATPALVSKGPDSAVGTFQSGYGTSCVLTGGGVACWGDDSYGGLGRGALVKSACSGGGVCDPIPDAIALPNSKFTPRQIATGGFWAMALSKENQILAWGANLDGRIGHAPGLAVDLTSCGYDGQQICNPTPQIIPQPGAVP